MTQTPIQSTGRLRLTDEQVQTYRREGYLIVREPIFPQAKFEKLKQYFESLLDNLDVGQRPEAMDVPHFVHPELFEWLFADEVLDLVEPILGPNIALWSSHFICKPKGDGKRVPWHEDSAYWKGSLEPMEVCTVWLAIDPSTTENGCMYVIPRTHDHGFSDYEPVDPAKNVFHTEITPSQRKDQLAVPVELQPNQASLHDGRLQHGSPANTSNLRRCGYTMRYMPSYVKHTPRCDANGRPLHQIYLARGRDLAGNHYADPTRSYPELARFREQSGKKFH
ncbi:MAG: phytanoyl-CoA dioxygenase family protein [Anaerolineae bacterium]|nr:phytanoyl-CoA dioxygenase family protein [Candidatus Roseilinea sp.]MDW8448803.1 phytanoyl-CoA dioxygenase family protein [Anaerolineae bacterium]